MELRLAPHRKAGQMVLLLEECFASKVSLDAEFFAASSSELQMMLFESHCAEAFIHQGGLEALLALAAVADQPSVQSNALEALRSVLAFPSGVERLLAIDGSPALVRLTFELDNPRVLLVSIELLCLLCSREDGFRIVHSATLTVARERDELTHAQLVRIVELCPDVNVKTVALTLINQLVLSVGDLPSRAKLHALLDRRLRLHEVLSSQLHMAHAPFRAQLEFNEQLLSRVVPGSWGEAEQLRYKCTRLTQRVAHANGACALPCRMTVRAAHVQRCCAASRW